MFNTILIIFFFSFWFYFVVFLSCFFVSYHSFPFVILLSIRQRGKGRHKIMYVNVRLLVCFYAARFFFFVVSSYCFDCIHILVACLSFSLHPPVTYPLAFLHLHPPPPGFFLPFLSCPSFTILHHSIQLVELKKQSSPIYFKVVTTNQRSLLY